MQGNATDPFIGTRSLVRKVMVDGVKTEDGILLPKGAMVSILARPAQCDEENFEDPYKFDPLRFSRMRANNASSDDHNSKKDKGANLSFISTSPHYLPFGHGRHACPGRFTIDFELKMMIAYLLTNYELEFPKEHNGERPRCDWVTEAIMPPVKGKLRIKRRM